jgi:hypothetical protein
VKNATDSAPKTSPAISPFGVELPDFSKLAASVPGNIATAWPAYMVDAFQRSVLFMELLRRRGNQEIEIESEPTATVLRYEHEVLLDGKSLQRPMNYMLSRIVPLAGVTTDPQKRPVVVVDPRAGQGPGIGGFKAESEIGDALNAGHPVYFIGFSATPVQGQQFLDIVEGQVRFFERVAELHPDAPRAFAIGNCQAGYQTLMVAMLRPDLFGPCLVAGSPMSYWQGVHGKNPMRYAGGLLGGSWLTAMASDLGRGKIEGTALVQNFDNLGPANFLWGKQYEIYTHVDTGGERYLEFEKWWGDFIELNGDELQYLVDNLFIGDKLTRNELKSHDGTIFDVRNITSPIIVFTSMGDNISPPQQTLGWILDLYRDVGEIRAAGRTIVYCLDQKIGHLAIFVSTKVGAKEDEEFVQLMDVIDCMPPGLYEMVISPRPADMPSGRLRHRQLAHAFRGTIVRRSARARPQQPGGRPRLCRRGAHVRAESRDLPHHDAAAGACAGHPAGGGPDEETGPAAPQLHDVYRRQSVDEWRAETGGQRCRGAQAGRCRQSVPRAAEQMSDQIVAGLEAYRVARDRMAEQMFFGIYGSPIVQALLGIGENTEVRPAPGISPEKLAAQQEEARAYAAMLTTGGFDEALTRAVLYVFAAERAVDQRCALALNCARQHCMRLSLAAFKVLVRNQFFVLQLEGERAIEALAEMVPEADARAALAEACARDRKRGRSPDRGRA